MATKADEKAQKADGNVKEVLIVIWLAVILVSAAVSAVITYPLLKKVEALENMCEMLSKAVRGQYDEKE